MSVETQIDTRLKAVERAIFDIQRQLAVVQNSPNNWITRITGSFENEPEFDEVLRLGREFRYADMPEHEVDSDV